MRRWPYRIHQLGRGSPTAAASGRDFEQPFQKGPRLLIMHEMMAKQADSSIGPVERLIELRDDVANQIRVSAAAAGAMPVHQVDIGIDHL